VLEPLRSADDVRRLVADNELWDALTAAPLGALLRDTFADDTVRGIVATDALIGTFADLDEPSLAQNICFLYHLMGGGTGDWDVPVGGMGAVTDALAKAAVGAGAEIVTDADVLSVDGKSSGGWATVSSAPAATSTPAWHRRGWTSCWPPRTRRPSPVTSRHPRVPSSRSTSCSPGSRG
jgi:phytoene dehydrogenase-like protein